MVFQKKVKSPNICTIIPCSLPYVSHVYYWILKLNHLPIVICIVKLYDLFQVMLLGNIFWQEIGQNILV
jgi:hypothetical protein